jgi:antitoxin (DNA-binding transcriptional repressor) of toxin-antitoxin stability system
MRSVHVAELQNRLSKYLTFAKGGEELAIRNRNLPVGRLVRFWRKAPTITNLVWLRPGNCVLLRGDSV